MAQTLPDCQHIPLSVVYDCSNPVPDCTSTKRLDFVTLWNYTNVIYRACETDPRLFRPIEDVVPSERSISLTLDACVSATGGGWTSYPRSDIWTRLTTWKFPLLQLVFTFPRPPLSAAIETFVIFHLLGDPIDTIANLLGKLSTCQYWAKHWQEADFQKAEERKRHWRALTLITDAYAEWEADEELKSVLQEALIKHGARTSLKERIHQTAQALAADRATKSLPVFAAQIFFIVTIGVSIFRTADVANSGSNAFNNTIFANIEAFSIAFSALYFWIIPTVVFASLIGVSQTEAAIPRILGRFQDDLNHRRRLKNKVLLPNACLVIGEKRKFHGGIYQWQPSKYKTQINYSYRNEQSVQIQTDDPRQSTAIQPLMKDRQTQNGTTSPGATSNMHHMILAHIIVIAGAATGLVISSLVPPAGINCRHCGELAILVTWMVSAYIDILFSKVFSLHGEPLKFFKWSVQSSTMLFWTTFVKDIVFTGATMGGIILTQWGILNRCECYSNWGRTGIALPQTPDVSMVLKERINTWYPAITGIGLCFQLILVSSYITWQYGSALRVYIQRDDDKSNTPDWLKKVGRCGRSVLSKKNRGQNSNGRRTNKRIDTSSLERGGSAGGIPLEVQAQKPGASGPDAPLLAVKSRFEHAARAI